MIRTGNRDMKNKNYADYLLGQLWQKFKRIEADGGYVFLNGKSMESIYFLFPVFRGPWVCTHQLQGSGSSVRNLGRIFRLWRRIMS